MDREYIHNFWRNPNDSNKATNYLKGIERSEFLLELIKRYAGKNSRILEIGCNVGRNLNHLYSKGFNNLSGVEINADAVGLMKEYYPKLKAKIYNNPIEEIITKLEKYDVIYTVAVLEHIHTDSEWIFKEIQKRAKVLITMEDEKGISGRHFPRNYKNFFKGQVEEIQLSEKEGLDKNFKARVFIKPIWKTIK